MRTGISITVNRADRLRLEGVVRDRNAAQKHVWRAAIVLLSADGAGTTEIMRRTGKSKSRHDPAMACDHASSLVNQDRDRPAPFTNTGRDLRHLAVAVSPRIPR